MTHRFIAETGDGSQPSAPQQGIDRRSLLSSVAMFTGLAAAYGLFAGFAARFLFPARPAPKEWLFVLELASVPAGAALAYQTPTGQRVSIARLNAAGDSGDFIALSSTCPHLGCQVHWESASNRFFCPCHNGAFDPSGTAIEGPPKVARQSLSRYPLKVENGLLFIEVAVGGGLLA